MTVIHKPLPGDLVIRQQIDHTGVRSVVVFTVMHWPHTETSAGPYLSYGYALRKARDYAMRFHARVWYAKPGAEGDVNDVTEDWESEPAKTTPVTQAELPHEEQTRHPVAVRNRARKAAHR